MTNTAAEQFNTCLQHDINYCTSPDHRKRAIQYRQTARLSGFLQSNLIHFFNIIQTVVHPQAIGREQYNTERRPDCLAFKITQTILYD